MVVQYLCIELQTPATLIWFLRSMGHQKHCTYDYYLGSTCVHESNQLLIVCLLFMNIAVYGKLYRELPIVHLQYLPMPLKEVRSYLHKYTKGNKSLHIPHQVIRLEDRALSGAIEKFQAVVLSSLKDILLNLTCNVFKIYFLFLRFQSNLNG